MKADVVMKLLVLDGRVTKDGLRSLTTATACKTWIYAEDDAGGPLLGPADGLQTLALPSLGWILNSDEQGQKRYPYDKTFADAAFEVICVIHTSGTTGEPFYIL
jgi:acyl-coenzyme A synthetase/AMP-(fatty) acid ligase